MLIHDELEDPSIGIILEVLGMVEAWTDVDPDSSVEKPRWTE